jgi:hypothetical protein
MQRASESQEQEQPQQKKRKQGYVYNEVRNGICESHQPVLQINLDSTYSEEERQQLLRSMAPLKNAFLESSKQPQPPPTPQKKATTTVNRVLGVGIAVNHGKAMQVNWGASDTSVIYTTPSGGTGFHSSSSSDKTSVVLDVTEEVDSVYTTETGSGSESCGHSIETDSDDSDSDEDYRQKDSSSDDDDDSTTTSSSDD